MPNAPIVVIVWMPVKKPVEHHHHNKGQAYGQDECGNITHQSKTDAQRFYRQYMEKYSQQELPQHPYP